MFLKIVGKNVNYSYFIFDFIDLIIVNIIESDFDLGMVKGRLF